jgi:hypothetical protein
MCQGHNNAILEIKWSTSFQIPVDCSSGVQSMFKSIFSLRIDPMLSFEYALGRPSPSDSSRSSRGRKDDFSESVRVRARELENIFEGVLLIEGARGRDWGLADFRMFKISKL